MDASPLTQRNIRRIFQFFFLFSAIMPILLLIYMGYYWVAPYLSEGQLIRLGAVFTYGLLALLAIQVVSFIFFFNYVRSLERVTREIRMRSADFLAGGHSFTSPSEITTISMVFDGLFHELNSKVEQINSFSSKLIESNVRLKDMAMKDELTGLYNRRYFEIRAHEEINRADRYHHRLAVLLLDIDDLKAYNDNNGHLAGDGLLKAFAQLMTCSIRASDIAFRLGGDEFALILPEADGEKASLIAGKLAALVEGHPFPQAENQPLGRISFSCGLAVYEEGSGLSADKLLDLADRRLYQAKADGKCRIVTGF